MRFRPVAAFAVAITCICTVLVAVASAASDPSWFRGDRPFTYQFPDPSFTEVGPYTIGYSTVHGGAHLPVEWGSDHLRFTPRPQHTSLSGFPYAGSDPYYNDALPNPGVGATTATSGHIRKQLWAPTVEFIGGKWMAFESVYVKATTTANRKRFCIYRYAATSPFGPFSLTSTTPFVCDADPNGSIDPDLFVDEDGRAYLLWKSEGVPGSTPTRIWSRELDASGTKWKAGSTKKQLLATTAAWEMQDPSTQRGVVENPSLVRWDGKVFLFYSGNDHSTSKYATGYASCAGPLGPCTKKTTSSPLLKSVTGRWGPGGADAFVDDRGNLVLAYHAWNASGGAASGALRKLYFARLSRTSLTTVGVAESVMARGSQSDALWLSTVAGGHVTDGLTIANTVVMRTGDFTGDDIDDLLLYNGDTATIIDRQGDGSSDTTVLDQTSGLLPLTGDFDGDGRDDIYWYAPGPNPREHPDVSPTPHEELWRFTSSSLVPTKVAHDQISVAFPFVGDFDGDGRDDIFFYVPGAGQDSIRYFTASGALDDAVPMTVSGFYRFPAVGDFDGDGDDDVLWYRHSSQADVAWYSTGRSTHASVALSVGGRYHPIVGDFDADGSDDVLWYTPGTGADWEWRNIGADATPGQVIERTVDQRWTAATGDLDGNGRDDIAWYR